MRQAQKACRTKVQEPLFVRGKSGLYYPFWAEIATSRTAFAMGKALGFAPCTPAACMEILDHGENAVDLSRLNSVGVLLFNHNTDKVVGKVIRAWVENHRGMAEVEFDTDDDAEKIFGKVRSGTLKTTSVRYSVDAWEEVVAGKQSADGRFTGPCQIARKWTPLEVSVVSVPADPTVGVGRADTGQTCAPLSVYERQIQANKNLIFNRR